MDNTEDYIEYRDFKDYKDLYNKKCVEVENLKIEIEILKSENKSLNDIIENSIVTMKKISTKL